MLFTVKCNFTFQFCISLFYHATHLIKKNYSSCFKLNWRLGDQKFILPYLRLLLSGESTPDSLGSVNHPSVLSHEGKKKITIKFIIKYCWYLYVQIVKKVSIGPPSTWHTTKKYYPDLWQISPFFFISIHHIITTWMNGRDAPDLILKLNIYET